MVAVMFETQETTAVTDEFDVGGSSEHIAAILRLGKPCHVALLPLLIDLLHHHNPRVRWARLGMRAASPISSRSCSITIVLGSREASTYPTLRGWHCGASARRKRSPLSANRRAILVGKT